MANQHKSHKKHKVVNGHRNKSNVNRAFHTGGRKGQGMPKAAIEQITTGPFAVGGVAVAVDGGEPTPMSARLVATSQTKITPGKGPESVLWNISLVNLTNGQIDSPQEWHGIAYPQMRWFLLQTQMAALGRNVESPSDLTKEDFHILHELAKTASPANILRHLQKPKPQNAPAASPRQHGPRQ